MSHCVSFEIALKLKAAGFPPAWQVMSSDVKVWAYNPSSINSDLYQLPLKEPNIFAPTISDILPLIKGRVIADPYGVGFCAECWHIHSKMFISKNIHDAAALAWLHQNESK